MYVQLFQLYILIVHQFWLSLYEINFSFFPCCSLLLHIILVLWLDNVFCFVMQEKTQEVKCLKLDRLMFPIFCLCNLKCYTHNTHHPNQIYCTLLIGKFNRFNTYKLIQTTQTNHTYDSIIRIIHLYKLFESLYHIHVSMYLSSASVLLYIDTLLTDSSKPN